MTSFAFIFGVLPLALATGAGANSRIAIGTAVIGGMLTATDPRDLLHPVVLRAGPARRPRRHRKAFASACGRGGRRRHEARRRPDRAARDRLHDDGAALCPAGPGDPGVLAGRRSLSRAGRSGLPVLTYQQIFQRSAAADADRAGAGQQPRPDGRRGEHRRRARAISHPARAAAADGRRQCRRHGQRRQVRATSSADYQCRRSASRASSSTCSAACAR